MFIGLNQDNPPFPCEHGKPGLGAGCSALQARVKHLHNLLPLLQTGLFLALAIKIKSCNIKILNVAFLPLAAQQMNKEVLALVIQFVKTPKSATSECQAESWSPLS